MKKNGLVAQFTRLLLTTGLGCVLLFFALDAVGRHALLYYNDHSDIQQRSTVWKAKTLQKHVDRNHVAATNRGQISAWVEDQGFLLLEIYRDHRVLYSSYAPEAMGTLRAPPEPEEQEFLYRIRFADGEAEVKIYYNQIFQYWFWLHRLLMVGCVGLFLLIFLLRCRAIVRYICLLSEEIQAMEGGDLEHPITVRGADELTTLASCLDSMRVTLRQQQQEEAEASAKVKNLITEMSHDLRTPLTTLLLYTEIVRCGKYQDGAQLHDYLGKIDAKARQLKQLSDNLFEYALVTRDTVVELDPPECFSRIFEEPLAEMVDTLQQRGFCCALELGSEDLLLTVRGQYIRRILDNISSNIQKYADPAQPVAVAFVREEGWAGLAFANAVLPGPRPEESTRVGVSSMETMMKKMNARLLVQQTDQHFCITLLFPVG